MNLIEVMQSRGGAVATFTADGEVALDTEAEAFSRFRCVGTLDREQFFALSESEPVVEWYINSNRPIIEPDHLDAAWTYNHCVVRCESSCLELAELISIVVRNIQSIENAWPALLIRLRRLASLSFYVHTNRTVFQSAPWISVRATQHTIITELLAYAGGYWAHAHLSQANFTAKSKRLIAISFTPFMLADNKVPPTEAENLLSANHPVFGSYCVD